MFRRLLWPIRYLRAGWQTLLEYPRGMAIEKRQHAYRCCLQVVGAVSERAPFTEGTIRAAIDINVRECTVSTKTTNCGT